MCCHGFVVVSAMLVAWYFAMDLPGRMGPTGSSRLGSSAAAESPFLYASRALCGMFGAAAIQRRLLAGAAAAHPADPADAHVVPGVPMSSPGFDFFVHLVGSSGNAGVAV